MATKIAAAREQIAKSDKASDDYADFVDAIYGDEPRHQLCGHPSLIQGEGMELHCELASNGHYCGHGDWSNLDDVLPQMTQSAGRWKLLLQVDSDEELGFAWGDGGTVYFWAPREASGTLDVERAWVAMQCY